MDDIGLVIMVVVMAITVYYIITDNTNKSNDTPKTSSSNNSQGSGGDLQDVSEEYADMSVDVGEKIKRAEEAKNNSRSVERRHNVQEDVTAVGATVMKQGDDYNPTHQPPLPVMKQVTTTTTTTTTYSSDDLSSDVTDADRDAMMNSLVRSSKEQLPEIEEEGIKIRCRYCDAEVEVPKGGCVQCPSCGGLVEA